MTLLTSYIILSDEKLEFFFKFGIQLFCMLACVSLFEHKRMLYIKA